MAELTFKLEAARLSKSLFLLYHKIPKTEPRSPTSHEKDKYKDIHPWTYFTEIMRHQTKPVRF